MSPISVGTCGRIEFLEISSADVYVDRQIRFPRSKKKRIRKKWAKDRRNWHSELVRSFGPKFRAFPGAIP